MKNLLPKLQLKISNKKEEKKIDRPNETNSPTIKKKTIKKLLHQAKKLLHQAKKLTNQLKRMML